MSSSSMSPEQVETKSSALTAAGSQTTVVPAFILKLWNLVEDEDTDDTICWDEESQGSMFHVFDTARFSREVLPRYFKHNKMSSFIRQLNMYGFKKVINLYHGGLAPDSDVLTFQHPCFKRGDVSLLLLIRRKVSTPRNFPVTTPAVTSPDTAGESGNTRSGTGLSHAGEDNMYSTIVSLQENVREMCGKNEEMCEKLEDVKRENEYLWKELLALRQRHQRQGEVITKILSYLNYLATRKQDGQDMLQWLSMGMALPDIPSSAVGQGGVAPGTAAPTGSKRAYPSFLPALPQISDSGAMTPPPPEGMTGDIETIFVTKKPRVSSDAANPTASSSSQSAVVEQLSLPELAKAGNSSSQAKTRVGGKQRSSSERFQEVPDVASSSKSDSQQYIVLSPGTDSSASSSTGKNQQLVQYIPVTLSTSATVATSSGNVSGQVLTPPPTKPKTRVATKTAFTMRKGQTTPTAAAAKPAPTSLLASSSTHRPQSQLQPLISGGEIVEYIAPAPVGVNISTGGVGDAAVSAGSMPPATTYYITPTGFPQLATAKQPTMATAKAQTTTTPAVDSGHKRQIFTLVPTTDGRYVVMDNGGSVGADPATAITTSAEAQLSTSTQQQMVSPTAGVAPLQLNISSTTVETPTPISPTAVVAPRVTQSAEPLQVPILTNADIVDVELQRSSPLTGEKLTLHCDRMSDDLMDLKDMLSGGLGGDTEAPPGSPAYSKYPQIDNDLLHSLFNTDADPNAVGDMGILPPSDNLPLAPGGVFPQTTSQMNTPVIMSGGDDADIFFHRL